MSLFSLYMLTFLPKLGITLVIVALVISAIIGASLLISVVENNGEEVERILKVGGGWVLLIWVLAMLPPSKSDMAFIAGGYVVTNADGVEKLPDNIVKAANQFLEQIGDDSEK